MKIQNPMPYHRNLISRPTGWLALLALAGQMLASAQPAAVPVVPAPSALPAAPPTLPPPTQPASYLAWDADSKNYDAKPGELTANFSCYVTNVSKEVVVVREVRRSCGCTEAKLPAQPWAMSPGTNGVIVATIDLRGRTGRITKTLTVESSAGSKTLLLNVNIPAATAPAPTVAVTTSSPPDTSPKPTALQ